MKDLRIHQGQTIRELVVVEDEGAISATFVATNSTDNIIEYEQEFSGLEAYITITDTIKPVGSYNYYYRIEWEDGSVDILPNLTDCEGECSFPQLVICETPGVS